MKPIIHAQHIGKKYNIRHHHGSYIALRDILTNFLKDPFSFLIRKAKRAVGFDTQEVFWALQDVSFSIEKGEIVGIIGRNGAGKSTLLKILSRITPPTTGEITIHGRVGSLLEVGTGFHPELTGRENIFLNGAILGMKKAEIEKKFDAIVSFADIEKFLDTPVKYYSSGMYVRLAFSVAAHMDPEILIIDEVLAVGDNDFQKKCLGKMEEVTKDEGRTILFVSHNMDAIRKLCTKTIWIEKGAVKKYGNTEDVVRAYLDQNQSSDRASWKRHGDEYHNQYFTPTQLQFLETEDHKKIISIEGIIDELSPDLTIGYALYDSSGTLLYWSYQTDGGETNHPILSLGTNKIESELPKNLLNNGYYQVELIGGIHNKLWLFEPGRGNPTITISVQDSMNRGAHWDQQRPGILAPQLPWRN